MNADQKQIKTPTPIQESEEYGLIPLFQIYCEHRFGSGTWETLLEIEEFEDMIENYYPKYGDSVFRNLVNVVVSEKDVILADLLADFSQFIKKYY